MDHISRNHVNLGMLLGVLFGVSFVAGIYYKFLLIFTGICLISYIILDKKKLRCPHCHSFENLDRLHYAKNNIHHCRRCGNRIVVL
ncbi:hypothetical protein [Ornithinibacillus halotolerans]|uniref:hypothetical protein n=1 Tax=Ornithinibacillus halotolerans TaxID=1274357 RepID=UPI00166D1F52|nr:hypothetical protein [Ornithinibacillus halotolerans]